MAVVERNRWVTLVTIMVTFPSDSRRFKDWVESSTLSATERQPLVLMLMTRRLYYSTQRWKHYATYKHEERSVREVSLVVNRVENKFMDISTCTHHGGQLRTDNNGILNS